MPLTDYKYAEYEIEGGYNFVEHHGFSEDADCPICGVAAGQFLPNIWHANDKTYMANFCADHGVEDLCQP